jgi:hypothetical protein
MSTNDPEFYQAPKFTPEQYQAPPRQRGCFFYGCIIASVLAVLMAILVGVVLFAGYRFLSGLVNDYTATAPEQLPKVEMPVEKRQTLQDRVKAFRKAVNDGTATEPLVLTGDDINALIDETAELKGTVYVKIEGDELKARVSIPLDKLPMPMFKGRYLNGEADLKASLFDGELIVHIDAIEVNGKRPPEAVMTDVRKQNFAKDIAKDPDNAAMLRKLESLEIKDGKIILKVRAKQGATRTEPSSKAALPAEALPSGKGQTKTEPSKTEPSKNGEPKPKTSAEPDAAPAAVKKS